MTRQLLLEFGNTIGVDDKFIWLPRASLPTSVDGLWEKRWKQDFGSLFPMKEVRVLNEWALAASKCSLILDSQSFTRLQSRNSPNSFHWQTQYWSKPLPLPASLPPAWKWRRYRIAWHMLLLPLLQVAKIGYGWPEASAPVNFYKALQFWEWSASDRSGARYKCVLSWQPHFGPQPKQITDDTMIVNIKSW